VKWTWLLAAAAIAGWGLARRHRQARWFQAAEALAVAGCVLVGAGIVHLPDFQKLLEDAGRSLGSWTYLVVGALAFLETGAFVGFVAPGETAVLVGGLVAGQGHISLLVLIAVVWTCAVAGDVTSYQLGRRLGREWLLRHGARLKVTEDRLHTVERFFERRGGTTILVGRFIGFVRPIAPFIAGTSRMPFRRFLAYDVLAAGAWSATFCILGAVFWRSIDRLTSYVSKGLFAFGTVVAIIAAVVALVRLRRDDETRARVRAWLDERADRPGWRPVVHLAGPVWRRLGRPTAAGADAAARFSYERLTPGNLGLELTTLLALLAVGGFAFILLGDMTQGAPPAVDRWAREVSDRLTSDWALDVARVLTHLGSFPVVAVVGLAVAVWALRRGRPVDAAALAAGLVLTYVAVYVAKDIYDRPRPSGSYVDTDSWAYPSGHALQAVTWVAAATVLVRAGSGWAARFAAETVAVVVVVVVAGTRVYLRAHFLTDVWGGVALGVAVWSVIGIAALSAGHVRHNGPSG
jgi:membrane protein DedA with SNARE-associated domain/membrane-associated phospholipid phosphatase